MSEEVKKAVDEVGYTKAEKVLVDVAVEASENENWGMIS